MSLVSQPRLTCRNRADCDVILLSKPLRQDLAEMREGQILWGWSHCVQNDDITQLGTDRRLTLIAFEVMNHWTGEGSLSLRRHGRRADGHRRGWCC